MSTTSSALARCVLAAIALLFVVGGARAGEHSSDVYGFSLQGVRLGMDRETFSRVSDIAVEPSRGPGNEVLAWRARTKKGFTGGGLFQVMFTREELGGTVYLVTLNRRWQVEHQDLDPIYAEFVHTYGPPDMFCLRQYDKHHVYHAYWGGKLQDCSKAGDALDVPHLYLNLVSGKWTEVFVNLSDPGLLQRNIEFLQSRKD